MNSNLAPEQRFNYWLGVEKAVNIKTEKHKIFIERNDHKN